MTTHQDTVYAAGFEGPLTGAVTGDVVGDITGDVTGGQYLPTETAYVADGAIALTIFNASLTKATPGAYTLAAPGAANVGKLMLISAGTAQAHVITAASLVGGNTLTYGGAIGNCVLLYGLSATVWAIVSLSGVTLSTI